MTPEEKARKEFIDKEYKRIKEQDKAKKKAAYEKKKKAKLGRSMSEKKAKAKAFKRYNDRVWKDWRTSDGKSSPVKVSKLDNNK